MSLNSSSSSSITTIDQDLMNRQIAQVVQLSNFFHLVISITGIVSNYMICGITVMQKSLHSHCNVLIAMEAFFLAGFNLYKFVNTLIGMLLAAPLISMRLCCAVFQAFSIGCTNAALFVMVLVALDRFSAVQWPLRYKLLARRKRLYLGCSFGICLLNTIPSVPGSIYQAIWIFPPEKEAVCFNTPCVPPFFLQIGQWKNSFVYCVAILAYIALFVVYRQKVVAHPSGHSESSEHSTTRRLAKALTALCIVYMLGILFNLATSVTGFFPLTQVGSKIVTNIYTFLIGLTQCGYAPMLYMFSSEHRNGFNKLIYKMLPPRENSNTIVPHSNSYGWTNGV